MQTPNYYSSVAPEALRPSRKGNSMLDTVKVAADSFRSLVFMASAERKEYTQERVPIDQKAQKRTADGVPIWSVQLAAVSWRGNPQMLTVSIASHDDPAGRFGAGELVRLDGLVFGVTAKRDGGYVTWCSADGIKTLAEAKTVRAVS